MRRTTREQRRQRRREIWRKAKTKLGKLGDVVAHELERPDFGLRLIIILKVLKGGLLLLVGLAALALIRHDLGADAHKIVEHFHWDVNGKWIHWALEKVAVITPGQLKLIGGGAMVYSAILLVEAWGLHKRRTWAEYMTIGVTALFIPVEIYELIEKQTIRMALVLLMNVAIVVYLGRHHFLFHAGPLWRRLKSLVSQPAPATPESGTRPESK